MRSDNKTSPARSNMPYNPHFPFQSQTYVQPTSSPSAMFLQGHNTIPASALRRTPGGLILLRSTPLSPARVHSRTLPPALQALSLKPYAQVLELLRRHQHALRKRERDPALTLHVAWLSLVHSRITFNRRALESFELSLAHTLFLEAHNPQQGVEALCGENCFDALVVEAPATPVLLKRAQRWLKPSAHNPLQPESANSLEQHPRERIFILLDEAGGTP
jgi:hypothetical protein